MSTLFFYFICRVLLVSTVAISVFGQFFSNFLSLRVLGPKIPPNTLLSNASLVLLWWEIRLHIHIQHAKCRFVYFSVYGFRYHAGRQKIL